MLSKVYWNGDTFSEIEIRSDSPRLLAVKITQQADFYTGQILESFLDVRLLGVILCDIQRSLNSLN